MPQSQMPLDFVRSSHAIMWNNGSLYPIKGMFVDDSVCAVVPKGRCVDTFTDTCADMCAGMCV